MFNKKPMPFTCRNLRRRWMILSERESALTLSSVRASASSTICFAAWTFLQKTIKKLEHNRHEKLGIYCGGKVQPSGTPQHWCGVITVIFHVSRKFHFWRISPIKMKITRKKGMARWRTYYWSFWNFWSHSFETLAPWAWLESSTLSNFKWSSRTINLERMLASLMSSEYPATGVSLLRVTSAADQFVSAGIGTSGTVVHFFQP